MMDTGFYNSLGTYTVESRCEIAREIGYEGAYITLWGDAWNQLPRFTASAKKNNLTIDGAWISLSMDDPAASLDSIRRAAEHLPEGAIIELALNYKPEVPRSSPDGDKVTVQFLNDAADIVESKGLRISIYNHIFWWAERVEDAVRLCRAVNRPSVVGITFASYHWYYVEIFKYNNCDIRTTIKDMMPYLMQVNFAAAVAEPNPERAKKCAYVNRPFMEGELDHFIVYALLREAGYNGRVGFNTYSVGGDAVYHQKRILSAFRDIEQRWRDHPQWAQLDVG